MQDNRIPLPPRCLLVASNLSEGSDEALRQANALARAVGAELMACHVIPAPLGLDCFFLHSNLPQPEKTAPLVVWGARELANRLFTVLGKHADGVQIQVAVGDPCFTLLNLAEEFGVDLLVLGSARTTGLRQVSLGKVAEDVVRYAHCPVLVARSSVRTGIILAATDFSDNSVPAVAAAAVFAAKTAARLIVVHCVDPNISTNNQAPLEMDVAMTPVSTPAGAHTREAAESRMSALLLSLGIDAEYRIAEGPAPSSVLSTVRELQPDLLVIAPHGETGLPCAPFGALTEIVLRHSPCSVLIMRRLRNLAAA